MSYSDTIFLFFLALILFGPKKLPEMARQAGRLLAELRRASNEFKSQIETEIAHLEVKNKQTELPATPTPQGTVASLSLNPGMVESIPQKAESPTSMASPAAETVIATNPVPALSSTTPTETVDEPSASTSQASHV